jgi:hypothetical protein
MMTSTRGPVDDAVCEAHAGATSTAPLMVGLDVDADSPNASV